MTSGPPTTDPVRVLIVDDEPPARQRLRRMLGQMPDVSVAAEAASGREALDLCARLDPDVVLLDVRMPGMDGIEAARHLAALEDPPAVIFTTAYDEHAVEAFETQAVGYLLKPVRQEKLERAMRNAARIAGVQLARISDQSRLGRRRRQISARLGDQLRLIPVDDVYYFMAGQKYVTVRHRGGSDLIDEPLRALEEEFAPDFLRVHRNTLVAGQCVSALERDEDGHFFVRLRDCDETLAVSRRHVARTLRRLKVGH